MWPALIRLPKRNGGVSTLHVITLFQWHLVVLFERNGGVSSPHVNPLSMIPRGRIWALANFPIPVLGTMRHQTFGWFGNGLKVFSPWPCSHEKIYIIFTIHCLIPWLDSPINTEIQCKCRSRSCCSPWSRKITFFFRKFLAYNLHTFKPRSSGGPIYYTLILQISSPPPSGDPGIASRSPERFPSCPEAKWSHVLNAICFDKVNDLSKHPHKIAPLFRLSKPQHWWTLAQHKSNDWLICPSFAPHLFNEQVLNRLSSGNSFIPLLRQVSFRHRTHISREEQTIFQGGSYSRPKWLNNILSMLTPLWVVILLAGMHKTRNQK